MAGSAIMQAMASPRRPPSLRCSPVSIGHVEIAMVVAPTSAVRKGRRIHRQPAVSPTMNTTASTTRGRSGVPGPGDFMQSSFSRAAALGAGAHASLRLGLNAPPGVVGVVSRQARDRGLRVRPRSFS